MPFAVTAETATEIVGVVKERVKARDAVRRFFLDNGRRMWGLPMDSTNDPPVQISVTQEPAGLATPTASLPASEHPLTKVAKWGFIPAALVAVVSSWYALKSETQAPAPLPQEPASSHIEREGSLLQYLEDQGEHRP